MLFIVQNLIIIKAIFIELIWSNLNYNCFGNGLINNLSLPYKEIYIQCQLNELIKSNNCHQNLKINLLDIKANKIIRFQQHFLNETLLKISFVDDSFTKNHIHLSFEFILDRKHICNSPYKIQVNGEYSNETIKNQTYWESINECKNDLKQIDRDFSSFKIIDFTRLKKIVSSFDVESRSQSVCLYKIINNQIFGKCYGKYVDFRSFIEKFLHSLLQKVKIDDVEFLFNLGDYPLSMKIKDDDESDKKWPIFSWCGSKKYNDIVLPTYEITQAIFSTRTKLQYLNSKKSIINYKPFDQRKDVAFFRGRDSRNSRLELAKLSKSFPKIIDAKITNFFFFPMNQSLKGDYVEFSKFFENKYVINMDGTVAAYKLASLLNGGSVILKHPSNYYEHFYEHFQDGQNIVFFKETLSNLIEKIEWLKSNPSQAKKIISNQLDLSIKYLSINNIYCYFFKALSKYKSKMNWDPNHNNLIKKEEYKLIKDNMRQEYKNSINKDEL